MAEGNKAAIFSMFAALKSAVSKRGFAIGDLLREIFHFIAVR
jgi:hypothetical protein